MDYFERRLFNARENDEIITVNFDMFGCVAASTTGIITSIFVNDLMIRFSVENLDFCIKTTAPITQMSKDEFNILGTIDICFDGGE